VATIIEEFIAVLDWDVDDKHVKEFSKQMTGVADLAKKAAVAIAGATAAAVGFAVVTNKQTAINNNLAASVGLSAESFDAWEGLLKQIGFEGEKVIDLVEEMNNKLGEFKGLGEFTAVEESLQILGLGFKELKDLAPEEQFLKIMSTAKDLRDQQKAVSAVDMLMGGEANRVLGFLRTMDGDLEGILKRRMQMNLLDKEAREGAVRFTAAWSDFTSVLGSLGAQFSGVLGDVLTPFLNVFVDWVATNRELIRTNVRGFVDGIASIIRFTVPLLKSFVGWIMDAVEALGGFRSVLRLIGFSLATFSMIKIITGLIAFTKAVQTATVAQTLLNLSVAAIPALIALAAVALGLIAEDIYQFLTGGESVTEKVVDSIVGMWREAVPIVEGYIGDAVSFWADTLGVTKDEVDGFLLSIEDAFKKTADAINSFYDFIVRDFEIAITKSVKFLQGIPLIGGLFSGIPTPPSDTALGPSPGAVTNNRTRGDTSVVINSPVEINAASDVDVDRAVRNMHDAIKEAAASAVVSNDTGVVY
jgi:hypothetical protein